MNRKYSKIACIADDTENAHQILNVFNKQYDFINVSENPDVIVILGGDGFMIHSLHRFMHLKIPFYGMNIGRIGFLLNQFAIDNLLTRIEKAQSTYIYPLKMLAKSIDNITYTKLAVNEIYLLRDTNQAAMINVYINGILQMSEVVCDGMIVSTAAGSTAYNLSAGGPVIPLEADLLALTPLNPFRPRRWRGALLPNSAIIKFEVIEPNKRIINAIADFHEIRQIINVEVVEERNMKINLLFDEGHSLEERIIREQFSL